MSGKYIKEYITLSVLAVIFSVCSLLPSGTLATDFAALLVALTGYTVTRYHYAFVGFVCVCILASSAIISHNVTAALLSYSEIILYGLALGICFNIKLSGIKTIGILSAFHIAYMIISTLVAGNANELLPAINENVQSMYPLYADFVSQADFNAAMSFAVAQITKFIPGFFVIASFVAASIYFGVFRLVLKITKTKSHYGRFSDCHCDKSISIIYFVLLFITMILPADNYYTDAINNVILISGTIFYVFGLAYISFRLNQRIKNTLKRKLIFALTIFSSLFLAGIPFMVISFSGALDGIVDFRKKTQRI